jgi:hypothetical protein
MSVALLCAESVAADAASKMKPSERETAFVMVCFWLILNQDAWRKIIGNQGAYRNVVFFWFDCADIITSSASIAPTM